MDCIVQGVAKSWTQLRLFTSHVDYTLGLSTHGAVHLGLSTHGAVHGA